jgi:MFS family permease
VAVNKRFHNEKGLDLSDWILVGGAVLLMGIAANTGYALLPVLFSTQGLKPEAIAIALSVYGLCLLGGKLVYGFLSDRIGSYLCNWLYGFLMIMGYTGLCLTGSFPYFLFPAVAAAGAGMAVSVVGTVAWAWDLSRESRRDQTIQRFQLIMNAGGLSFNIVPGIIADRCNGSYIPAFIILTLFCILLVIMIQTEYIRKGASRSPILYKQ